MIKRAICSNARVLWSMGLWLRTCLLFIQEVVNHKSPKKPTGSRA